MFNYTPLAEVQWAKMLEAMQEHWLGSFLFNVLGYLLILLPAALLIRYWKNSPLVQRGRTACLFFRSYRSRETCNHILQREFLYCKVDISLSCAQVRGLSTRCCMCWCLEMTGPKTHWKKLKQVKWLWKLNHSRRKRSQRCPLPSTAAGWPCV